MAKNLSQLETDSQIDGDAFLENLYNDLQKNPQKYKNTTFQSNSANSPTNTSGDLDLNSLYNKVVNAPPENKKVNMSVVQNEVAKQKGALEKVSSFFEPSLKAGAEVFINPIGREFARPVVSVVRGIQGSNESVNTPFGEVKPYSELSSGEAAMGAAEVGLTVLPAEKLLAKPAKLVANFFGGAAKRLGSVISGKSVNVIDKIISEPRIAKEGLRGDEVSVLKEISNEARNAVSNLQKIAGQEYEKAIDSLPQVAEIEPMKIVNRIKTKFDDFGIKLDKGNLSFAESPLDEAQQKVVTKMWELMKEPKNFNNPKSMNILAQKISKFRKVGDKELNNIVDTARRAVRDIVGDEVPQLREALKKYSDKQDFLDAVRTELSISGKTDSTEGIIKTSKKLQNIFNSNKELAVDLVENLEKESGTKILAKEAGRQLGAQPSRAQVSIGDGLRGIVQTVIPPKAVGEMAAATGIAKEKIKPFVDLLSKFAPVERIAVFNLFRSALNEEEKQ